MTAALLQVMLLIYGRMLTTLLSLPSAGVTRYWPVCVAVYSSFLVDCTATQYDRLLASCCCPSVRPSVHPSVCPSICLSVTLCIVALRVGVRS